MIISDAQARIAARYVAPVGPQGQASAHEQLSPELLERVRVALDSAPDTREDRVAEARERMCAGSCDSREIASKMIARIISDAVR